jgi:hypothetical protein
MEKKWAEQSTELDSTQPEATEKDWVQRQNFR